MVAFAVAGCLEVMKGTQLSAEKGKKLEEDLKPLVKKKIAD